MRPASVFLACFVASIVAPGIASAQDVRVGGMVKEPVQIKRVEPVYPEIAVRAKVAGTVILEILVDKDGRVTDAKALRPIALLTEAAIDAVHQWRYTPTLVNGVPTDVRMTVAVNFSLDGQRASALAARPAAQQAEIDAMLDEYKRLREQGQAAEAERVLARLMTALQSEGPKAQFEAGTVPIRVGGAVKEPRQIRRVEPKYPEVAQAAQVQGTVILEVVIAADGNVSTVKLLRSIPLLDQAAVDAVRQWRYEPTLLNGVPVEVIMTVTVNFTLR